MRVAVLPGDGIGPEIIAQATKVLRKLQPSIEMKEAPVGGAGYEAAGDPLPAATLSLAKEADAVLFGAVGDARYDRLERAKRPEQAILSLRKELGVHLRRARGRLGAEARGRRRPRHPDRARAYRGHLLRAAARHPRGGRRERGLRHHALQRARDPAHCARRLRGGAQAVWKTLFGGQGERARDFAVVERNSHG